MLLSDRFIHDTGNGYPKRYIICLIHRGKDRRLRFHPPRPHARCSKSRSGSRLPPSRRPIRVNFRKVLPKIAFFRVPQHSGGWFLHSVRGQAPATGQARRSRPDAIPAHGIFPGLSPATVFPDKKIQRRDTFRRKVPPVPQRRMNPSGITICIIFIIIYIKRLITHFEIACSRHGTHLQKAENHPFFKQGQTFSPQKILIYLKRFILLQ